MIQGHTQCNEVRRELALPHPEHCPLCGTGPCPGEVALAVEMHGSFQARMLAAEKRIGEIERMLEGMQP